MGGLTGVWRSSSDRVSVPSGLLRPGADGPPRNLAVDFATIHHAVYPDFPPEDLVDDSEIPDSELPIAVKRLAKARTIMVGRHAEATLDGPKDALAQIRRETSKIFRELRVEPNGEQRSIGHVPTLALGRQTSSNLLCRERPGRLPRASPLVGQPIQRAVLMKFDRFADQIVRHLRKRRAPFPGETLHDGEQPRFEERVNSGALCSHDDCVAQVQHLVKVMCTEVR